MERIYRSSKSLSSTKTKLKTRFTKKPETEPEMKSNSLISPSQSNPKNTMAKLDALPAELIERVLLEVCPMYSHEALKTPGEKPDARTPTYATRDEWRRNTYLRSEVRDLIRILQTCKTIYNAANTLLYRCPFIFSGYWTVESTCCKLKLLLRTLEENPGLAALAIAFYCEEPGWEPLNKKLERSTARVGLNSGVYINDRLHVSLAKLVLANLPRVRHLSMSYRFDAMADPATEMISLESLESMVTGNLQWKHGPVGIGALVPNLRLLWLREDPWGMHEWAGLSDGPPLTKLTCLVVEAEWISPAMFQCLLPHTTRLETFSCQSYPTGGDIITEAIVVEGLASHCAGSLRTMCLKIESVGWIGTLPSFDAFRKLENVYLKSDIVVNSGPTDTDPQVGIWSLPPSLRRLHLETHRMTETDMGEWVPWFTEVPSKAYIAVVGEWLATKVAKGAYPVLEELAIPKQAHPSAAVAGEIAALGIRMLDKADCSPMFW